MINALFEMLIKRSRLTPEPSDSSSSSSSGGTPVPPGDPDISVEILSDYDNAEYSFGCYSSSDYVVDWGDGTVTTNVLYHTYSSQGQYIIRIYGIENVEFNNDGSSGASIVRLVSMNPNAFTTTVNNMFNNCTSLQTIEEGVSLPVLQSYDSVFNNCNSLTEYPDSLFGPALESGNAITYNNVFAYCTSLTDVGNLLDGASSSNSAFYGVFQGCWSLQSYRQTSEMPPIANSLFMGCTGLQSNLTNMSRAVDWTYAYYNCTGLTTVDLSQLATESGDYACMNYMFANCSSVEYVTFPDTTVYVNTIEGMFNYCENILNVSGTPTFVPEGDGTTCASMFYFCHSMTGCSIIQSLLNETWDEHSYCFYECTSLPEYNDIPYDWKRF